MNRTLKCPILIVKGNNMLIAKDLVKDFDNNKRTVSVIKDVSLEIKDGEFVAITGSSGSGKSTLLYLLSGLDTPTSGNIELNDKELSALGDKEMARLRRQEISFVYQFYNLIPNLSVKENIELPVRIDRKLNDKDREFLDDLMNLAGISQLKDRFPYEISGGEQQRTALIRALFTKPSIIFMDEPCGNLDSVASDDVMHLICDINQKYNTTIVMVTHDNSQANLADRIIKLQDGKII